MLTALPNSTKDQTSDKTLNNRIMSDINNEIIDYLKLEKQVRLDGLEMMDKSAEIPQRLLKEVSIFDRWIEHLANGVDTSDSGLHLQRVSNNEVAVCPYCKEPASINNKCVNIACANWLNKC